LGNGSGTSKFIEINNKIIENGIKKGGEARAVPFTLDKFDCRHIFASKRKG
jgi:hypothetical protein